VTPGPRQRLLFRHAEPNIRYVVKKLVKWRDSVAPNVVELVNQMLERFVPYGGRRDGRRFIRKEVAIVRRS
jgi:hypothetical protein